MYDARSPLKLWLGGKEKDVSAFFFPGGFHTACGGFIAVYHAHRGSCVVGKGEGLEISFLFSRGL